MIVLQEMPACERFEVLVKKIKFLIVPKKSRKSEERLQCKIRRFSSVSSSLDVSFLMDADRRMSVALEEIETFEREYLKGTPPQMLIFPKSETSNTSGKVQIDAFEGNGKKCC